MEDVLELYRLPYDPTIPVVCMDEQPVQLVAETRVPIATEPGKPERYDYIYERHGMANVFMFVEPLGCRRIVHVRDRKTKTDWAQEVRDLLETSYPDAPKVRLVCDNLNTHTPAALYEAFPPDIARGLVCRLDIHHTPKHGSWLNIAEIELSVLTGQCVKDRRIPNADVLRAEVDAWQADRNQQQKGVDWHFTIDNARTKLKRLYPRFQT
jgi:hypothetical protein